MSDPLNRLVYTGPLIGGNGEPPIGQQRRDPVIIRGPSTAATPDPNSPAPANGVTVNYSWAVNQASIFTQNDTGGTLKILIDGDADNPAADDNYDFELKESTDLPTHMPIQVRCKKISVYFNDDGGTPTYTYGTTFVIRGWPELRQT
jgi:hypothetical protein